MQRAIAHHALIKDAHPITRRGIGGKCRQPVVKQPQATVTYRQVTLAVNLKVPIETLVITPPRRTPEVSGPLFGNSLKWRPCTRVSHALL